MINTLSEMDLHQTPVSTGRMAGIEFQANALHTLLHHRPLVQASDMETALTVVVLALFSALVLSQLAAVPGAVFTLLLAAAYFVFTSIRFDAGHLPDVLFPYLTIFTNYAALSATRFASEQVGRRRVSDIFGRFVSADVRDMIVDMALEDPELIQPGGRQMDISVLFADIRGFTTLSENLPPPEVVEILNQYLESMGEQIFAHGGTLDKYTGDGMMVLFGAPLEQPDHAERAVRAALAMQQAAAQVSDERGEVEWDMVYGIGITTGPAVVGHIGSKRRLDYTAIGDTVNLAARLEGKAPPGAIYINQATYNAVKHIALVEALEPTMVKGKAKPVVVYKVVGLRDEAE
jgi:adenylate cyclase